MVLNSSASKGDKFKKFKQIVIVVSGLLMSYLQREISLIK